MSLRGVKCLVLGAGGFIGSNLLAALARDGARVTAFGRRPSIPTPAHAAATWIEAEFGDVGRLAEAVEGQELVFHLLGGSIPAESNEEPSRDVIDSLLPSIHLIEACRAKGVRRIVFASSGGTVYGPGPDRPVAEDAATNPITAYGINKLAVEKYLGLFRRLHGLDPVVLRIANPYGPHQQGRRPQGIVGTAIAQALAGKPIEVWGDGNIVRDYLHIDDVVAALIAAAGYAGKHWLFNVGSGEGTTVSDMVSAILSIMGAAPELIHYQQGRPVDLPYSVLNTGLIRQEMGWCPSIPLEQGLRHTIEWWQTRR